LSWVWAKAPALSAVPSAALRPTVMTIRETVVIDRLL
jgi:hypothetical protein